MPTVIIIHPSGYGKQNPNQKKRTGKESYWDIFQKKTKGKYKKGDEKKKRVDYQKFKAGQEAKLKNKPKAKKPSGKNGNKKVPNPYRKVVDMRML